MADDSRENALIEEVREVFTVKTLQERVWRLEAENTELKMNNSILHTQYTSMRETQSDILRTMHANLDENFVKIEELEAKVLSLQQELEDQKQEAKDELEAHKAQAASQQGQLQTKNEYLENELQKVNEFRENKAQMEAENASLKAKLEKQAEDHQRDISAFDRRRALEIDQLRKDMNRSIKETKEMLRNRTKDQLDTTTKRTIMENEQMATELHFQSKETERLLAKNQSLLDENAQLRRSLAIHKDLENELARRTHVYQKLIKKMDQRKKTDVMASDQSRDNKTLEESFAAHEGDSEAGDRSIKSNVEKKDHEHSEEIDHYRKQVEGVQATLQMVRHEFQQYRRDHATLTQLQDQSTRLIIAALYELKNQRECDPFPPSSYDEHANWQFTTLTTRQKEYFFRMLLEKLNSGMCGSCFPTGQNASTSSLPKLGKGGEGANVSKSGAHISQFLWSMASHGGSTHHQSVSVHSGHVELSNKACQTETNATDPCFQEGLWDPRSRSRLTDGSASVTPSLVSGNLRPWGERVRKPKTGISRLV